MKVLIQVTLFVSFFCTVVFAQEAVNNTDTICKGKIVPIGELPGAGVLYKPSNLHGGRGPSFLVQNASQRTNKKVLEIRNARCEVIATIGLYATDQPYGSRYYMRSGGSGQDDTQLLALANLVGSNSILIEGINGTWVRIKNPTQREGSVRK
jgi:hypothetical protein